MVKLNLGCGKTKVEEGFIGVDKIGYEHVQIVTDLTEKWPWEDGLVDEVASRNLVNYFHASQRIHFANELYRVLKPGGTALLVTPHWACNRAYGDLSAPMPPVAEEWFFFLNKKWREENAYWVTEYCCDFEFTCGYGLHPHLFTRNQEYQYHALTFWKEAGQELIATLTKR